MDERESNITISPTAARAWARVFKSIYENRKEYYRKRAEDDAKTDERSSDTPSQRNRKR